MGDHWIPLQLGHKGGCIMQQVRVGAIFPNSGGTRGLEVPPPSLKDFVPCIYSFNLNSLS